MGQVEQPEADGGVTKSSDEQDVLLAGEALEKATGLKTRRVPRTSAKTPDLELLDEEGAVVAICEVKTATANSDSPDLVRRVEGHIQKAVGQLNSNGRPPDVLRFLIIVNRDGMSDFGDLREALTKHFFTDDGRAFRTRVPIRRLDFAIGEIDASGWVEPGTKFPVWVAHGEVGSDRAKRVQAMLRLDTIKPLDPRG